MKRSHIDEPAIAELVERFYGYARADARLGPVFAAAVHDWPGHMATLKDFWSSVMLGSGRYKGNPFAIHTALPLEPGLFQDWLGLWHRTTAELFEPEVAAQFDARAARIADSLKAGLFFNPSRTAG